MKTTLIILSVLCVLLIAGVARSHYKIKRIEIEFSNTKKELTLVKSQNLVYLSNIATLEANQLVIVNYLFPPKEEEPQQSRNIPLDFEQPLN